MVTDCCAGQWYTLTYYTGQIAGYNDETNNMMKVVLDGREVKDFDGRIVRLGVVISLVALSGVGALLCTCVQCRHLNEQWSFTKYTSMQGKQP